MAPRLKVFTWSDGFHAFTVAASSRPKALAAWGVEQDLFKSGLATEINAGPDHAAALAQPGEVIERGLAIDPGRMAPVRKPKPPSGAARARLEALEVELAALDERHSADSGILEGKAKAIAAEQAALAKRQKVERDKMLKQLKAARDRV